MKLLRRADMKMIIRKAIGEAELTEGLYKGETIQLGTTLNGAPVIEFPNKDKIIFTWDDLVDIAIEFREKENKRILEELEKKEICPRCGFNVLNPIEERNALSRRANVYICSTCGSHEGMMDVVGQPPIPFHEWAIMKGEE